MVHNRANKYLEREKGREFLLHFLREICIANKGNYFERV